MKKIKNWVLVSLAMVAIFLIISNEVTDHFMFSDQKLAFISSVRFNGTSFYVSAETTDNGKIYLIELPHDNVSTEKLVSYLQYEKDGRVKDVKETVFVHIKYKGHVFFVNHATVVDFGVANSYDSYGNPQDFDWIKF